MINAQRARNGELAVFLHTQLNGGNDDPLEDQLVDLLTDLIHWTDTKTIDFDAMVDTAFTHYRAEIHEEKTA